MTTGSIPFYLYSLNFPHIIGQTHAIQESGGTLALEQGTKASKGVDVEKGKNQQKESTREPAARPLEEAQAPRCAEDDIFYINCPPYAVPYISLGAEIIYDGSFHHLFNPKLKLHFHNSNPLDTSYGIGPELQGHLGTSRQAISAGLSSRYLLNVMVAWVTGELSLRGGLGNLDVKDDADVSHSGVYGILAADAMVSALGVYFGAGIRKEFRPEGLNAEKKRVAPEGPQIYPAFSLGIGYY